VPAVVHLEDAVVHALRAHLHLGHSQVPQPAQFIRRDLVRPCLDHQPDVSMFRRFVQRLRLCQVGCGLVSDCRPLPVSTLIVHRLEASLHEPFLVLTLVGAPSPSQDQQFDLVRRVSQVRQRRDPRPHLCVRVEVVFQAAHRARLIRQIRFRHPNVRRAEDAFAGARVRLGQHRHGRHARERPHRLHAQAFEQPRIRLQFTAAHHLMVRSHQHIFPEIPAVRQRIGAQRFHRRASILDVA
jgi:hypothetical protein